MRQRLFDGGDDRRLQRSRRHAHAIGKRGERIEQVADHRHGMAGDAVELQRRSVVGFGEAGGDFVLEIDRLRNATSAPLRSSATRKARIDCRETGPSGSHSLSHARRKSRASGFLKAASRAGIGRSRDVRSGAIISADRPGCTLIRPETGHRKKRRRG